MMLNTITYIFYLFCRLNDNPVVHYRSVDCRGAETSFADCSFEDLPTPTTRCSGGRFASIRCCELI